MNFISDEQFIRKEFKKRLGREVNLENPIKFNDKIQWLKLNWRNPIATKCADKYEVREVIKERVGPHLLNELYGVYESVEEINIDKLPKSFVLKGTHGSGFNIICKDKDQLDWNIEFEKMKTWLKTNYYWTSREWVYKDIKPRIVCEKYLIDDDIKDLRDYKFFCFNGEPKLIQVDFDRFNNHKRNIYDIEWNLTDIEIQYPSAKNEIITKPKTLDSMLEISRILSKDFPHVRVDFYNIDETIIFGELTFFHGSGMEKFNSADFEIKIGKWLELSH
jgi:hypothetical protein